MAQLFGDNEIYLTYKDSNGEQFTQTIADFISEGFLIDSRTGQLLAPINAVSSTNIHSPIPQVFHLNQVVLHCDNYVKKDINLRELVSVMSRDGVPEGMIVNSVIAYGV